MTCGSRAYKYLQHPVTVESHLTADTSLLYPSLRHKQQLNSATRAQRRLPVTLSFTQKSDLQTGQTTTHTEMSNITVNSKPTLQCRHNRDHPLLGTWSSVACEGSADACASAVGTTPSKKRNIQSVKIQKKQKWTESLLLIHLWQTATQT